MASRGPVLSKNRTERGTPMADKERTLTDRMRDAASSPTAKRVVDAGRQFVRDPLGVEGAVRAMKSRKKGKERRSSSR